jgi:hypothetical protein
VSDAKWLVDFNAPTDVLYFFAIFQRESPFLTLYVWANVCDVNEVARMVVAATEKIVFFLTLV